MPERRTALEETYGLEEPRTVAVSYWTEGGNPVKQSARERLASSSAVDLYWLDPESTHPSLYDEGIDAYHMSKQRHGSMEDAAGFEAEEVPVLNGLDDIDLTNDRAASMAYWDREGLPVPDWDGGAADEISVESQTGMVIVKDRSEAYGDGHDHTLTSQENLSFEGAQVVQEYLPGPTIKLYRIPHGRERPTYYAEMLDGHRNRGGEEVRPSTGLQEIGDRITAATDLQMFEVDAIMTGDGYRIVDVNPFISGRSLAGADRLFNDAIVHQAATARRSRPTAEPAAPRRSPSPSR